jgi:hypothetical protein
MDAESWKSHIKFFLEPYPKYHATGEDMWIPGKDYKIAFIFNGVLRIVGDARSLIVNYNSPHYLILIIETSSSKHVYSVPWEHLVAFELIQDHDTPEDALWPPRFTLN